MAFREVRFTSVEIELFADVVMRVEAEAVFLGKDGFDVQISDPIIVDNGGLRLAKISPLDLSAMAKAWVKAQLVESLG